MTFAALMQSKDLMHISPQHALATRSHHVGMCVSAATRVRVSVYLASHALCVCVCVYVYVYS